MIEYDRFIYLDVYRTGSTHVLKRLADAVGGKPLRFHRHAAVTKARPLAFIGGKFTFATVRNPWDWYVSLWAFGAAGNSAIRRYLSAHLPEAEVAALYDGSMPARSFQRWLKLMHDPAVLDRIMQEHLPQSGLAPVMGLYSYRFLRVATLYPRLLLRKRFVSSAEGHLRRFKAYSEVVRTETLDAGLDRVLQKLRLAPGQSPPRLINASPRSLPDYRDYYDTASRNLVAARDRMFGDVFGYEF
jgi:hypothetical protein